MSNSDVAQIFWRDLTTYESAKIRRTRENLPNKEEKDKFDHWLMDRMQCRAYAKDKNFIQCLREIVNGNDFYNTIKLK